MESRQLTDCYVSDWAGERYQLVSYGLIKRRAVRNRVKELVGRTRDRRINLFGKFFLINGHGQATDRRRLDSLVNRANLVAISIYLSGYLGHCSLDGPILRCNAESVQMARIQRLVDIIARFDLKAFETRQVAQCYFRDGQAPREIARVTGFTVKRITKMLWGLRYSQKTLLQTLERDPHAAQRILISHAPRLVRLYKRRAFCLKSLRGQHAQFQTLSPNCQSVSFGQYVRFAKQYLGLRRVRISRKGGKLDSPDRKLLRKSIAVTLIKLILDGYYVIFYDGSLLAPCNFQRSMWTLTGTKRITHPFRCIGGFANVIMCCDTERVISYRVAKSIKTEESACFLLDTIMHLRQVEGKNKMVVFLDNARIHHTKQFKLIAKRTGVYFLYNAPISCKINLIEFVFEVMKRRVRRQADRQFGTSAVTELKRLAMTVIDRDLKHEKRKWLREIVRVIRLENMW